MEILAVCQVIDQKRVRDVAVIVHAVMGLCEVTKDELLENLLFWLHGKSTKARCVGRPSVTGDEHLGRIVIGSVRRVDDGADGEISEGLAAENAQFREPPVRLEAYRNLDRWPIVQRAQGVPLHDIQSGTIQVNGAENSKRECGNNMIVKLGPRPIDRDCNTRVLDRYPIVLVAVDHNFTRIGDTSFRKGGNLSIRVASWDGDSRNDLADGCDSLVEIDERIL